MQCAPWQVNALLTAKPSTCKQGQPAKAARFDYRNADSGRNHKPFQQQVCMSHAQIFVHEDYSLLNATSNGLTDSCQVAGNVSCTSGQVLISV